jgi:uncharacterized protein
MSTPRIHIVHGYTATPTDHWFPWLRETLAAEGAEVHVPAMPDSGRPRADLWHAHLGRTLGIPGRHDILLGHSLGCITLIQYLQSLPEPQSIGGLILVAGFDRILPGLPELTPFVRPAYDPEKIKRIAPHRACLASLDDAVVPHPFSKALATRLECPLRSVTHGGHFLGREGFTTLPPVLELIREMR